MLPFNSTVTESMLLLELEDATYSVLKIFMNLAAVYWITVLPSERKYLAFEEEENANTNAFIFSDCQLTVLVRHSYSSLTIPLIGAPEVIDETDTIAILP